MTDNDKLSVWSWLCIVLFFAGMLLTTLSPYFIIVCIVMIPLFGWSVGLMPGPPL